MSNKKKIAVFLSGLDEEYQNQIIETAEEARRANVAKTEFLRRMSHDIRTPINGVIGMLNIGDHFPEDMIRESTTFSVCRICRSWTGSFC